MITYWNPRTIWIYKECYIRFSPIDYDITKFNDKYMHLTNNAIVSKCDEFYESEIEGNMWSCELEAFSLATSLYVPLTYLSSESYFDLFVSALLKFILTSF